MAGHVLERIPSTQEGDTAPRPFADVALGPEYLPPVVIDHVKSSVGEFKGVLTPASPYPRSLFAAGKQGHTSVGGHQNPGLRPPPKHLVQSKFKLKCGRSLGGVHGDAACGRASRKYRRIPDGA